jgi:YHS domain-containing protein
MRLTTAITAAAVLSLISTAAFAQDKPAAKKPAAKAPVVANATKGGKAMCPIMNHEFSMKASSPKASYKGKDYALCCAGCKPEFEKTPAKFAAMFEKKPAAPAKKKS